MTDVSRATPADREAAAVIVIDIATDLFWWARVTWKRIACRFMTLTEFCRGCGVQQPIVWHVDDELWAAVTGRTDGGGVLCPACFSDLALERKVGLLMWTARPDR